MKHPNWNAEGSSYLRRSILMPVGVVAYSYVERGGVPDRSCLDCIET